MCPHEEMVPCLVCEGIMGEGICRMDKLCEVHTNAQAGNCPTCEETTAACDRRGCTKGIE